MALTTLVNLFTTLSSSSNNDQVIYHPMYKRDLYEYQDVVFLLKILLFNFLWNASYMCNYLKTFFIFFCLWVFTLKYKNKVLFPPEGCVMLGIALKPFLSFIFCDFVENSCVACHCGDLYWSLLKFKKWEKRFFKYQIFQQGLSKQVTTCLSIK